MRRIILLSLCTFWQLSNVAAQVFDDDFVESQEASVKTELAFRSDRIFRGQNLFNGASIQPAATMKYQTGMGALKLGFFSHIAAEKGDPRAPRGEVSEVTNEDGSVTTLAETQSEFNEYDFMISFEVPLVVGDLEFGNNWYTYDESTPRLEDTAELFVQYSIDTFLQPHVLAAYDYDEHSGFYYEFGFSEPIPLERDYGGNSITPSFVVGLSNSLDGGDRPIYDSSGFAFVDFGLSGSVYLTEAFSLEPSINYTEGIDDFADSEFSLGVNVVGIFGL